jgi:hypothetical protein
MHAKIESHRQHLRTQNEIIGYALTSQVDVIDGGDCFEPRHKLAPAVFKGVISSTNGDTSSVIAGRIEVPASAGIGF